MDNSAAPIHHFNLLQIQPSCITELYSRNTTSIAARCSLQVRKAQTISISTLIAAHLWLLTSAPSTVTTGITLVCPEGPTKLIAIWKPIHILQLPPACSATSPYFYIPPHYEPTTIAVNYFFGDSKTQYDKHISIGLLYMATPRETPE